MSDKDKRNNRHWQLTVDTILEDGVLVVAPAGRIGHVSATALHQTMDEEISRGSRRVAIDLERVDYIGSAGLVVLDAVARRLHDLNGRLLLCALSESARLAFELAGWTDRFPVEASRRDAVRRLAA